MDLEFRGVALGYVFDPVDVGCLISFGRLKHHVPSKAVRKPGVDLYCHRNAIITVSKTD